MITPYLKYLRAEKEAIDDGLLSDRLAVRLWETAARRTKLSHDRMTDLYAIATMATQMIKDLKEDQ